MRDLPQLKSLFRKNIKVVPGGPAVGTPGSNRAEGVLNSLDALAEEVKDIDAYTKQEVDYLLDGQIGYLPDLPTVAKNNIVSSIRELSRQKVSIAALAPTIGPLAYFASYAEAEQYALSGDTIYLSGTHASISVAKSVSLHGGNIKELTVGYRTGPLAVNVAGALCGGRIVTCVPATDGGKHTVTYTNIVTGPATFFEQFSLEGGNGAWADVTISQTRLHNRGAYIAPANGVPAGGCVRWQERGGRYSRYTVLDSTLRSDNNAIGTGYPDPATEFILAGSTDVQPGAGHGLQETMLLNSGVVQPDADIIVDQRTSGALRFFYTIAAADLPEPRIEVPGTVTSVGIRGANGSLNPLAYGVGYEQQGNVLVILAAANVQEGEVVEANYQQGAASGGQQLVAGAGIDITNNVISATSGALVSQHTTFQAGRFTGPMQFVNRRPNGLSVQVISNVALLFAQVNYQDTANMGTWVPGETHASASNSPDDLAALLADVEADIAAIPAAALAVGAEVLFRTYPLDNSLEADFLLTGFSSAIYFGRALAFRVASSGVPLGNIVLNSQFLDNSAWTVPNAGVTVGNNQAAFTVRDAYIFQVVTTQADNYELRLRILNIEAGGYVFVGVGPVGSGDYRAQQYYTIPGDYVLSFNWPTTSQLQFLLQGAPGSVVSHLYCVPN